MENSLAPSTSLPRAFTAAQPPSAPCVLGLTAGGNLKENKCDAPRHLEPSRHQATPGPLAPWHFQHRPGAGRSPGSLWLLPPPQTAVYTPLHPDLFPPGCELNLHILLCLRIVSALHTLNSGTAGATRGLTASDSPAPGAEGARFIAVDK